MAGSRPGPPETKACSDGRSSFRKTASRSPGSPLCPAEPDEEEEVQRKADRERSVQLLGGFEGQESPFTDIREL